MLKKDPVKVRYLIAAACLALLVVAAAAVLFAYASGPLDLDSNTVLDRAVSPDGRVLATALVRDGGAISSAEDTLVALQDRWTFQGVLGRFTPFVYHDSAVVFQTPGWANIKLHWHGKTLQILTRHGGFQHLARWQNTMISVKKAV